MTFQDFKILVYPENGSPIFATQLDYLPKEVHYAPTLMGRSTLQDHIRRMQGIGVIVPMFLNPRAPEGDWKCIQYKFGDNRIAGYYR